ncbi:MAG: GGDEF domain-containing protein [Halioglobus sp.]
MRFISTVIITIIAGFVIFRWQMDDVRGAAIDAAIVLLMTATLVLGNTERFASLALKLFGVTISTSCILSAFLVSSNGLLWALLVLLVNGMTLDRKWSLGLNIAVILILSAAPFLFDSLLQQVSWATVATLIASFSIMSMDQLRIQRHKLVRQANIDPLTQAGNRRLMTKHMQDVLAERRTERQGTTLMMIDLDKFKSINDHHGHDTGDKVLIEFVRSAYSVLRSGDGLYRMGGEEFVLLLRGMDEETAQAFLPRLHKRLSGGVITPNGPLEFSAGAAVAREGEDWPAWLARADKALYRAKEEGRNRLCFGEFEQ